ncbi:MAG: hypothetical protein KAT79_03735 [candidate division Zixibacteria bacterium]|nr:hypothetical protein [candidate division Zixibacteria bacterium]
MISRITGKLTRVSDSSALVENGGIYYEVLVPSALAERMKKNGKIGGDVSFETIYYIEAGDKKSSHYPKMVGFTDPIDKEFFSLFIQVPGLGVKKALKCLILPINEIATAIETKEAGTLVRLPGVGGRLAEKIIAELHGKTAKFALSKTSEPLSKEATAKPTTPLQQEAVEVLLQLQYNQKEAEEMVRSALKENTKVSRVEDLISHVFRSEIKPQT